MILTIYCQEICINYKNIIKTFYNVRKCIIFAIDNPEIMLMKVLDIIIIITTIIFFFAVQFVVGSFPVTFFAFPLNVVLIFLWLLALWLLYKDYRQSRLTRFLLSLRATVITFIAFILFCLVMGLVPQYPVEPVGVEQTVWERLGIHELTTSWPFLFVLLLLQSHLAMITFRGQYKRKGIRWRFLACHLGLWLALLGGFWGSADTLTLRAPVYKGQPGRMAYAMDGRVHYLDYDLELRQFQISYYDNGMPRTYQADVEINGRPVTLRVNDPYAIRFGEDLYLTGYDMHAQDEVRYCVLQVVKQPWKYVQLAGIILMLLASVALFVKGPKKRKKDDQLG